jgi:AraC family transcriptional regulator
MHTGVSPGTLLWVEKAKMLLEKTSMPIVEIAYECGFSHQEHLTRLFKRYCATTPAAYRKSRRSQLSAFCRRQRS